MSVGTRPPQFTLVGGAARSGKSRFALKRATELGRRPLFVATAECRDQEMQARVDQHRAERGSLFRTIELPYTPDAALLQPDCDVVLIDCLTLWLSNLLVRGDEPKEIDAHVSQLEVAVLACPVPVIVVSNEVGLGIVPDNALARTFRDVVGRTHQRLASVADELYFAQMGVTLRLKPAPVEIVH